MQLTATLVLMLLSMFTMTRRFPEPGADEVEQQVRQASVEEIRAFRDNDPAAMDRLWSADFVVTNPLNKLVDKREVLELVRSGYLTFASYDRDIEYTHAYGDTVILAGTEKMVWGGKSPLARKSQRLRFTAIWIKQQGKWLEVARHANAILEK